jgi:hypothetical protein
MSFWEWLSLALVSVGVAVLLVAPAAEAQEKAIPTS